LNSQNYKLVIFDLDGVIINSKDNMRLSWDFVSKEFNLDIPFENYFNLIGRPFKDILTALNINDLQTDIENYYNRKSKENINYINYYPNAVDTLKYLHSKGMKLAIVTSKDKDRTNLFIKDIKNLFSIIVCPTPFLKGKPYPDQILFAIKETSVVAKKSIYIGDMTVDSDAASAANISYLHAGWGYGKFDGPSKLILKNFEQLKNL